MAKQLRGALNIPIILKQVMKKASKFQLKYTHRENLAFVMVDRGGGSIDVSNVG